MQFESEPQEVVGEDGIRYELVFTGEADLVRGPLGRFIDLAEQIEAEGLKVPAEILDVLVELQRPKD